MTNLRGAAPDPTKRSRGELVGNFVRGTAPAAEFIDDVYSRRDRYAGFHLIAGTIGGDVLEGGGEPPHSITGVHALSNAPPGERWEKVDVAEREMRRLSNIEDAGELVDASMRFLRSRDGSVFIAGDRYGTRSSTVIVANGDRITFVEQSFARGGVPDGEPRLATCRYSLALPIC